MSDRDPIWDAMKAHSKEKFDSDRKSFLDKAKVDDDGGWVKHTEYHWARIIAGKRLDYWPSRNKFAYDGKVQRGDVRRFIHSLVAQESASMSNEGQCRTNHSMEIDSLARKCDEQAAEIARLKAVIGKCQKHLTRINKTSGYRDGEQQLLDELEALAAIKEEGL